MTVSVLLRLLLFWLEKVFTWDKQSHETGWHQTAISLEVLNRRGWSHLRLYDTTAEAQWHSSGLNSRMCPLMHSPFKRIYECNDRNGLNRSVIAVLILLADPKWNLLSDEQQQQQQNNNMDLCMLRNFRAGGKASSWRRSSLFWPGKCGHASNRCHVTIRCRVHCPCVTKKNTSPKKNLSSPIKIIR